MEEISKKVILNGYVYALLKPVVYQKAIPRNSGFGRCRPTGGAPSLHALCCCPHTTRFLSQESTAATRTQPLRASWATKGHKTRWKSYLQHLIQSDPANLSNTAQGTQTFHRGIAPQRRASSISGVQEFPTSEREHTRPLTHRQGTFLPASARQPADPGQWAPRSQPGPARAPPRCVQRLRAPAAQTPVAEWPPRAGFLGHGAARAGGERGSPRSPRARLSLATRSAPARPDGGPAPRGGSRVRRLRGRDLLLARRALRCAHLFSFLAAAIAATNTLRPSRPLEVTASRGVSLPSPRRRPAAAPVELRSRRRPRPGSAPPAPSSGRQSPPRPADARRRGAAPAVPALAARQAGGGMGSVERARPLPAGRGGAAANGRFQRAPPMAASRLRGEKSCRPNSGRGPVLPFPSTLMPRHSATAPSLPPLGHLCGSSSHLDRNRFACRPVPRHPVPPALFTAALLLIPPVLPAPLLTDKLDWPQSGLEGTHLLTENPPVGGWAGAEARRRPGTRCVERQR